MSVVRPLRSRSLDFAYVVFFATHVPVILSVDLVSIYPTWMTTNWMMSIRQTYIELFDDILFKQPPTWFLLFVWLELLYHIPLAFWIIPALVKDQPRASLQLFLFGAQVTATTLICVVYQWLSSQTNTSALEKLPLMGLYMAYISLPIVMMFDGYSRLCNRPKQPKSTGTKTD